MRLEFVKLNGFDHDNFPYTYKMEDFLRAWFKAHGVWVDKFFHVGYNWAVRTGEIVYNFGINCWMLKYI